MRVQEAFRAVDAFPHPRLWTVLAELSLEALDLTTAEKAFVRAGDYQVCLLSKYMAISVSGIDD